MGKAIDLNKTQLGGLQKVLKAKTSDPEHALINLVFRIGQLSMALKGGLEKGSKVIIKGHLSDILTEVCIMANGADFTIPDPDSSLRFHGPNSLAIASEYTLRTMIGALNALYSSPQSGAQSVGKIVTAIISMSEAIDIKYQDVIDHAVKTIK